MSTNKTSKTPNIKRKSVTKTKKHVDKRKHIELSSDNLRHVDAMYDGREPIAFLVYSLNCGFCRMMKPSWDSFAVKAVSKGVTNIVCIDNQEFNDLKQQGVASRFLSSVDKLYKGSVPLIGFVDSKGVVSEYKGDRSEASLAAFVSSK